MLDGAECGGVRKKWARFAIRNSETYLIIVIDCVMHGMTPSTLRITAWAAESARTSNRRMVVRRHLFPWFACVSSWSGCLVNVCLDICTPAKYRTVIFVNGCFRAWAIEDAKYFVPPKVMWEFNDQDWTNWRRTWMNDPVGVVRVAYAWCSRCGNAGNWTKEREMIPKGDWMGQKWIGAEACWKITENAGRKVKWNPINMEEGKR